MTTKALIPVPEQTDDNSVNDRRLWIGNLDHRITEYVLLKLVQRFGKPERFDFMYHITGPEKGKPKGYCFVTYPSREEAEKAVRSLNGKLALSRRLAVHWARDKYHNDPIPSCSSSLTTKGPETKPESVPESSESTESKIRAIEAKLVAMQETQKDFGVSELPSAPPGSNRLSSVHAAQKTKASGSGRGSGRGSFHRRRPYVPNHHRGRRR
ncbi:putative RNA-binding protein 18 [Babylonia areolata]|uniref:putative RNA-binding protein 18 n=1 Tax=Babylonia areolata TaxID=304850 RepID=UPI003FD5AD50